MVRIRNLVDRTNDGGEEVDGSDEEEEGFVEVDRWVV